MSEASYIPLYSATQVREFDRIAIEEKGVTGYELMCRAGRALARCVEHFWPEARRVTVLAGPGNNAGDGYFVARLLQEAGCDVLVLHVCDPDALQGAALQAVQDYRAAGGALQAFGGALPGPCDLFIDALLGTGLDREVQGAYRQVIELVNAHAAPVLAADIPSGLHADSGRVLGDAVQAQRTLSFIGRKRGMFTGSGLQHAGEVDFDDLGVARDIFSATPGAVQLVEQAPFASLRRPRRRDAHKGDFGHVLVVGGAPGFSGAARLAAQAAARCGAGLVTVATCRERAATLNADCPELMVHGVTGPVDLDPLLSRASVVVIGPGMGRDAWSQGLLGRVLETDLPLVVDADALNLLAEDRLRRTEWLLTPHPGEAGRLLGCSSSEVESDRFSAVRELVDRYGGVVVLKGAGTLIATSGQEIRLCGEGNPGMASAGMGDVLSGVLGALLAQGLDLFDAATLGVTLHARAADRLAAQEGERGLLASDLIPMLRRLINAR